MEGRQTCNEREREKKMYLLKDQLDSISFQIHLCMRGPHLLRSLLLVPLNTGPHGRGPPGDELQGTQELPENKELKNKQRKEKRKRKKEKITKR